MSTPTLSPAGPCASAVYGRTGQERVSVTDSEEAGQMHGTTAREGNHMQLVHQDVSVVDGQNTVQQCTWGCSPLMYVSMYVYYT